MEHLNHLYHRFRFFVGGLETDDPLVRAPFFVEADAFDCLRVILAAAGD